MKTTTGKRYSHARKKTPLCKRRPAPWKPPAGKDVITQAELAAVNPFNVFDVVFRTLQDFEAKKKALRARIKRGAEIEPGPLGPDTVKVKQSKPSPTPLVKDLLICGAVAAF